MAKKYIINCHGKAVEITKTNSMIHICKMPYKDVVAKKYSAIIQNPFIVYILHGINESGNRGKGYAVIGSLRDYFDKNISLIQLILMYNF